MYNSIKQYPLRPNFDHHFDFILVFFIFSIIEIICEKYTDKKILTSDASYIYAKSIHYVINLNIDQADRLRIALSLETIFYRNTSANLLLSFNISNKCFSAI
jgi:hypothetical protein